MKDVATEAGLDLNETQSLENSIKEEMKKNNLDWLLNGN